MFPTKTRYVVVESPRGYGAREVCQMETYDAHFEPYQIHVCFNALQKTLQQCDIKLERVPHLRFLTMYSRLQNAGGQEQNWTVGLRICLRLFRSRSRNTEK
jgi:hypothetical protein